MLKSGKFQILYTFQNFRFHWAGFAEITILFDYLGKYSVSVRQYEIAIVSSIRSVMEESFFLILLCLVMLGGSYFAGSIPLVVSLSEVSSSCT